MVKVWNFLTWHQEAGKAGKTVRAPHKGTLFRIGAAKGTIIPGTEEDVDPSDIDEQGRYRADLKKKEPPRK